MVCRRRALAAAALMSLALAACGDGGDDTSATPATTSANISSPRGVTAEGITPERCAQNKAAGKIVYLSSFDFAATASIVEVVVADAKGYYNQLCLDVDLKNGFSATNYPLVAAGDAEFSSAGSYSEVVDFEQQTGARFVVVQQDGHTGIDALLVRGDEGITELSQLAGKTIGVKGKITPSVKAMLYGAGLMEGKDYKTVVLDGYDPKAHIQQPVAGFPVYKSNEPGQLERAGIPFVLFDPTQRGIPGSFGIIYTNADFLADHPTAVQDFVRASLKGLEDAIADPEAAIAVSLAKIREGGNKRFLSDEGESFRWRTEARIVTDSTPDGVGVGVIQPAELRQEVEVFAKASVFEHTPDIEGTFDETIAASVYGPDNTVIFPRTPGG